jgi:hypothetical protein
MIINGVTKDSIVLVLDNVQAKHIVELLRIVTEEQLTIAAEIVKDAGFDTGCPLDALAAARSFSNIVGYYTDRIKNVEPAREREAAPILEPPTSGFIN